MNDRRSDGQLSDVQMPFTSHLAELRSRLVKSVLAVALGFAGAFAFVDEIFAILAAPLRRLEIEGLALIGTAVTEAFFMKMKVAFAAAVIVTSPVLLWQLWQFVAPGLYKHEKNAFLPFLVATPFMFLVGATFLYYLILPFALKFFVGFEVPSGEGTLASSSWMRPRISATSLSRRPWSGARASAV